MKCFNSQHCREIIPDVQVRLTSDWVHTHSASFVSKPEHFKILKVIRSAFKFDLQQNIALILVMAHLCILSELKIITFVCFIRKSMFCKCGYAILYSTVHTLDIHIV